MTSILVYKKVQTKTKHNIISSLTIIVVKLCNCEFFLLPKKNTKKGRKTIHWIAIKGEELELK